MELKTQYLPGSPTSTDGQRSAEKERLEYFESGVGSLSDKINSFSRFMSRQNMAKLSAYQEVFSMTRGVLGSILECGVYYGHGLMTYANLSAALEPYNYQCKVVGFDTFSGDVGVSDKDRANRFFKREDGDYLADSFDDLTRSIRIFDRDRPINHIPKVELVRGDIRETAAIYLRDNPALAVRILHLSMNVYEPTKAALRHFLPRVARGGIVAIMGLNCTAAGAAQALIEEVGDLRRLALKTFEYYPNFTYFTVE